MVIKCERSSAAVLALVKELRTACIAIAKEHSIDLNQLGRPTTADTRDLSGLWWLLYRNSIQSLTVCALDLDGLAFVNEATMTLVALNQLLSLEVWLRSDLNRPVRVLHYYSL